MGSRLHEQSLNSQKGPPNLDDIRGQHIWTLSLPPPPPDKRKAQSAQLLFFGNDKKLVITKRVFSLRESQESLESLGSLESP